MGLLVALALWVAMPLGALTGVALALAGVLHAVRLARWAGHRTFAEPLVTVLHAGYAFVPLGPWRLRRKSCPGTVGMAGAQQLWMPGAIGLMTLAVMTRATLAIRGSRWRGPGRRDLPRADPVGACAGRRGSGPRLPGRCTWWPGWAVIMAFRRLRAGLCGGLRSPACGQADLRARRWAGGVRGGLRIFLLSHSVPVRPPVRGWLQARLGRAGSRWPISVLSLAALAWLIGAAGRGASCGLVHWRRGRRICRSPSWGGLPDPGVSLRAAEPVSPSGARANHLFDPARPGIVRWSRIRASGAGAVGRRPCGAERGSGACDPVWHLLRGSRWSAVAYRPPQAPRDGRSVAAPAGGRRRRAAVCRAERRWRASWRGARFMRR